MGDIIRIHLCKGYDRELSPVPAVRQREWFEDNRATKDHARHCLPLAMANSLGYYIRSPGTFRVRWDGDPAKRATVEAIEKSSHYEVDNHATFGGFTVQAKFIPVTDDPGDFVYVKGVPNERAMPYSCMEACIEAWWNVGHFGLVYLLNQPCDITVYMGQPIAQMILFKGRGGAAQMELVDGYPEGHRHWRAKRERPDYVKDLDYFKGRTSRGEDVPTHINTWKQATQFK